MSFPQGARVGPYEVLNQLGTGGMGGVSEPTTRDSAAISPEGTGARSSPIAAPGGRGRGRAERLLREATLASALNNPNTSRSTKQAPWDDRYIAMELVEGRTLRQLAAEAFARTRDQHCPSDSGSACRRAHAQIVPATSSRIRHGPADGYIKLSFRSCASAPGQSDSRTHGPATDPGSSSAPSVHGDEQARGENRRARGRHLRLGAMLYEITTGVTLHGRVAARHAARADVEHRSHRPSSTRSRGRLINSSLKRSRRMHGFAGRGRVSIARAAPRFVDATSLSAVTVAHRTARSSARWSAAISRWTRCFTNSSGPTGQGTHRGAVGRKPALGKTTLLEAFVRLLGIG